MKPIKMSLANLQGKLSRADMKQIMAGSDDNCATYYCGSTGLPCCDPHDQCSGAGTSSVCEDRPITGG